MLKLYRTTDGFTVFEILASLAVVITISLAGWLVYQKHPTPNSTPIMVVSYTGGLCAPHSTCSSQYNLYPNGTFDKHTKLSAAEVSKLKQFIAQTDFLRYPKNPKPFCPSYTDGSDESLAFPQKYKDTMFKLCELIIPDDDPAITFINDLISAHQPKL